MHPLAPDMGEEIRAEQRACQTIVEPARGDQANWRLHDLNRPTLLSDLDRVGPCHRGDPHRFQDAATIGLGAKIKPQSGIDIAGVALLDVEMSREYLNVVDRHEFVQA